MIEVLETCADVVHKSRHVRIDEEALTRFCRHTIDQEVGIPPWDGRYHFRGEEEETAASVLVLDTLNFCFWPPPGENKWEIMYKGKTYSGYYGLSVSLKKAIESGTPVTDASFLASLTLKILGQVFAGTGVLQLMVERLRNLQELGRVLQDKYNGQASELVTAAGGSAIKLVRMLAAEGGEADPAGSFVQSRS